MLELVSALIVLAFVTLAITFGCLKLDFKFELRYEGINQEKSKELKSLAVIALTTFIGSVGWQYGFMFGILMAAIAGLIAAVALSYLYYTGSTEKMQSEPASSTT